MIKRRKKKPASHVGTIAAPWAKHDRVCKAFARGERMTVSQWAATHRVLNERESAEPGNWSNERTPYLVAPMDALGDPDITDIVIMKAAQVGASEMIRNAFGYWVDQDPGPTLFVMPDEDSAKEILAEKLHPYIKRTARLSDHLTANKRDLGHRKILLDNMETHAAWAGSPQSLASRPKRRVIFDEADKYPAWSGKEADPISLGSKRTTTFGHRALRVIQGTPTTRMGPIWQAWEACPVKYRFHVPCPDCGEYAVPAWTQIRWPEVPGTREEQGAAIERDGLAWYQCALCEAKIQERQRSAILRHGVWCPEGYQTVNRDGELVGTAPDSRRVGFHIPATISPWVSWSQMAGEFVAAIGHENKMMDWRNSRLGEPYEVRAAAIRSDVFEAKVRAGHKPGIVPSWASMLIATVDTQKDHFWYVIRAWGVGFKSRLITYGKVGTFAELRDRCLGSSYPVDDASRGKIAPHVLLIDSGGGTADDDHDLNRTHQVYQFAQSDPARIFACKGWGGKAELEAPIRQTYISAALPGSAQPAKVSLYHLKVGYFKDILAARMGTTDETVTDRWEVHEKIDIEYMRQMASEHKVLLRKGRQQIARWVPVASGAANHLWDCEAMQIAGSQIAHVETPPPPRYKVGRVGSYGV